MNKKGFTLIELLAVIVILAIVSFITISLIGNVIKSSKMGALTASVNGLIESADLYYSTKMIDNPETKTFICSKDGCFSENEKLEYKGFIQEGRLILYSDGKVSACIEDGTHAALKLANQTTITTKEGSCNYDDENYQIDETISKSKYNKLLDELNDGKKKIADSITNKGIETSSSASFDDMANNIDKISTGIEEQEVVNQLSDALQYSGLGVTQETSLSDIYSILKEKFPAHMSLGAPFNTSEWIGSTGHEVNNNTGGYSYSIQSGKLAFYATKSNADTYASSSATITLKDRIDLRPYKTLNFVASGSSTINTNTETSLKVYINNKEVYSAYNNFNVNAMIDISAYGENSIISFTANAYQTYQTANTCSISASITKLYFSA